MATASRKIESLICSLCLDVFEKATLLGCGHTFCRKCLEKYYQCYSSNDDIVLCPLCRRETELSGDGLVSLPANVSINSLVEEVNSDSNPIVKLYENGPKCSQCLANDGEEESECLTPMAVAFCSVCDLYFCESCLASHKTFERNIFSGHRVISVEDIMSGKEERGKNLDKCPEHKSEIREFYCADCRAVICHKCTIVKHNVRNHRILERIEFEQEIRTKIRHRVKQCETEKIDLENCIKDVERKRRCSGAALKGVLNSIDDAFADLHERIEERKAQLKSEVKCVEVCCDEKLDAIKSEAQKMSSQLSTSQDLLRCQGGRGCLEGDALLLHERLCTDMDVLLERSQRWREGRQGIPDSLKETAARYKFDLNEIDISKIGQIYTGHEWTLFNETALGDNEPMNGLSIMSHDSVLCAYFNRQSEMISLNGQRTEAQVRRSMRDCALLSNGSLAVIPERGCLQLFAANGNRTTNNFTVLQTSSEMMLDRDKADNIYVCYWDEKLIHVFRPTGGEPISTFNVAATPEQIHTTSCGRIVIACPDGVRVLDEYGKEIAIIEKSEADWVYPAVDENDTLYIAFIYYGSKSTLVLKKYPNLDGMSMETILETKIQIPQRRWCYMKCPSPNVIVFCTTNRMYIFKKQLTMK